ncbi:unnamed protein product [Mytilus coruscus]|uniref:Uncharacterized protein n=1 Tax=Mytilus coruscus TaxID=42192 RepID=A0A6J8A8H7_MYTCO|nr:unnamed protein product [Mytilus coruscus]
MRQNSSVITRYNICELACKAYQKALSPETLQSAFRKTGIFPLDKSVINKDQLKPSEVFTTNDECKETTDEPKTDNIQVVEVDTNGEVTEAVEIAIVFGIPITETEVAEKVKQHVENQGKNKSTNQSSKKTWKQNKKKPSTSASSLTSIPSHTKPGPSCTSTKLGPSNTSPKPGPSNTSSKPGPSNTSSKPGPSHIYIDDSMDFSDTDDEEILEIELCCVCKQFTPNQIRLGVGVELTKWVQWDNYRCKHWTHLKYCTELRAVRRNTKFYCMHCKDME